MTCYGFLMLMSLLVGLSLSEDTVMEDSRLDFVNLVSKYGYPVEVHTVITSDGYVLTLHRIPYGRKCGAEHQRKSPVLVMHGLLCNSFCWVITGPEKSLGYILADECYDVWLGNSRGSIKPKAHMTLPSYGIRYWDFSWHELGAYDLPAMIGYILETTKQFNLHYIGHSQGTTQFFVFESLYPQYARKVRSFHALAPVAYVGHMKSPLVNLLAPFSRTAGGITNILGLGEFLPSNELLTLLGNEVCRNRHANQLLCTNAMFLLLGFDSEQLNTTVLPAIIGHVPAGASTKQLIHYAQLVLSGDFKRFDYSFLFNLQRYGSSQPPLYNLSLTTTPTALYYSLNDYFVDVRDVQQLASGLPNVMENYLVSFPKFTHVDFMWASDVKPLLYDKLLEVMNRY